MTPALLVGLAMLSAPAPLPKGVVARIPLPSGWRPSPQLAPAGDRLAFLTTKSVVIVDLATGVTRAIQDGDRTRYSNNNGGLSVAFGPAGDELFVGNYTSAVPVYDPRTGKHLRDVPVPPKKAQFPGKPDEPSLVWYIYPTPAAGGVLLFTTGTGAERLLAKDRWVALDGGGGWVTNVTRDGRFVGTVDTQASIEGSVNVIALGAKAGGFFIYPDDHFCTTRVLPSEDGKLCAATVQLNNLTLLPTPADDYVLRLWRTDDRTRVELQDATGYDVLNAELAFTPDGKVLFARRKGKIARWDTATGKRLGDVPLPTDGPVAFDEKRMKAYVIGGRFLYRVKLDAGR